MNKYFIFLFCLMSNILLAQTPVLERPVDVKIQNARPENVLKIITQQTGVVFSYNPDILKNLPSVSLNYHQKPVRLVLKRALGETISIREKGKYIILQKGKQIEKKKVIEGYIHEQHTGKNLKQATVYDKTSYASAITNEYGYFRLEVPESDSSTIMVSKEGKSDTLIASIPPKSDFVEVNFNPESDTLKKDTVKVLDEERNSFFPDWLVSEKLIVNTLNLSDTFFRSVSLSVLPFVSTNRLLTGNSVNNVAINLTVGYCQEIRIAEFGMINIVRNNVKYIQWAYIGNIIGGEMKGYQAASAFNISNSLYGFQVSGGFNICQYAQGLQMGSLFNRTHDIFGCQVTSGFNKAVNVTGVQISGIFNHADTIHGLQLASVFNSSKKNRGVQVAGILNVAEENDTCQISALVNVADTSNVQIAALLNVSKENKRIQIGVVNIAGDLANNQVGILNFSDSCAGVPVGILSFVKKGDHSLEFGYRESRYVSVGFRTGVKKFYNILMVGGRPGKDISENWFFAYGLGSAWKLNQEKDLFFELMKEEYLTKDRFSNRLDLYSLSAGINYQWKKNIGFSAAMTFNLMSHDPENSWQKEQSERILHYSFFESRNDRKELSGWIGLRLGVRFF